MQSRLMTLTIGAPLVAPLLMATIAMSFRFLVSASSGNWADVSELDFAEESKVNKEVSKKAGRKSGRARQREKQRRQIRTPSPEMRNPWCEGLEARTLPQLCLVYMN